MILFERSGGGNCEAISDGAVASSKVFDVHLDFAYSSDYSAHAKNHRVPPSTTEYHRVNFFDPK
jgi:hypothetical protein